MKKTLLAALLSTIGLAAHADITDNLIGQSIQQQCNYKAGFFKLGYGAAAVNMSPHDSYLQLYERDKILYQDKFIEPSERDMEMIMIYITKGYEAGMARKEQKIKWENEREEGLFKGLIVDVPLSHSEREAATIIFERNCVYNKEQSL